MTPPVLCYHRVGGPPELGVTRVSRAVFERQMTALARDGWRTVSLAEFADPRTARRAPRTFLLTFDDGYANLADHAYPILEHLDFTATTFLITDFVGRTNTWDARYTWSRLEHLRWDAVERWQARGFDFGSHGAAHQRLTWLSDSAVLSDLRRSRGALIDRLGPAAGMALAYPFGAVDARIIRLATQIGYGLGFGGVRGTGTLLHRARVPVYLWDVGSVPLGLRRDRFGALGRLVAHAANRCAIGTSIINRVRGPR
ncbi:MAG: polysaccharide deacetylase family protein [Gemmatimonadales bacterium]|nr:polysaccharide deacetylase family protein [Gemmatimonadales bacterium]